MKRTLEVLFLDELADMYDAEIRLTKALPKMVRAATHAELREAFQDHLDETGNQVERLKEVFETFGKKPKGKKCEAIIGLTQEADEIAADNKGHPTINAALISAAQKVEHYEIASYGCLVEWARQLYNEEAADLLRQTLEEEKAADRTLTELARHRCNASAQKDGSGEDNQKVGLRDRGRVAVTHARRSRAS
jgi:ferritin-like metal-binding protein YciE